MDDTKRCRKTQMCIRDSVSVEDVENMMAEIIAVPIDDGVTFQAVSYTHLFSPFRMNSARTTQTSRTMIAMKT